MDPPRAVFVSKRDRWRTLAYLAVFLGAWVGLGVLLRARFGWLLDPVALREYVRGFGPLAPLAFVLLGAVQVLVAPIPGQVLALAAGYLFGTVVGTVVSVVGATIGSYVAFVLSRRYGRSYVDRVVEPTVLEQFDALAGEHGLRALFLAFLVPGLPDDAICFAAGLTTLDIRKMTLVSFVGRLPGYFLIVLAGAGIADGRLLEAGLLIAAVVVLSAVTYLRRDRILASIGAR